MIFFPEISYERYVPHNLGICAISRLRCAFSESRNCVPISRLRTGFTQSYGGSGVHSDVGSAAGSQWVRSPPASCPQCFRSPPTPGSHSSRSRSALLPRMLFLRIRIIYFFIFLQVATALLVAGSTLTFWIPPFASTSSYSSLVQSIRLLI